MGKLLIRMKDESVRAICENDPQMKKLVQVIGDFDVTLRSDYLASIVRSIVGQQISVSAASAIYARLQALVGGRITAQGLLAKTHDELRQAGLTNRKAEYVHDLAGKIMAGELDLEQIHAYSDEAIMEQLTNVKGIGKWTAEMFLLLSLGRGDVLSVDDVGIQRAAKWLYGVETSERRAVLLAKSPLWAPYRSIASYYLWEATHLELMTTYGSVEEAAEIQEKAGS